jgi:lysophospholipase L1-like esterase
MQIRNGQKILFIGDSITDCGRRAAERPLGSGYVKQFADMLIVRHPKKAITVINKGIGGDVVTGLRNRWEDDVIRNKPDWLSIKIGINDLHRTLRTSPETIPPKLYREAYEDILQRTKKALPRCKILLIDSFYISTDTAPTSFRSEVLELLPQYLRVVNDLSRKYGTLHVKTHEVFQRLLKTHEPDTFCPEPVHPNLTGHLVIADAVFDTLSSGPT